MRLTHNLASLSIFNEQTKALRTQSTSMSRISSGIKINSAADGANEIAQSEKMRMQIRGMQMAQRNSQDGVSLLQVAEGGLDEVTSMLQRMRELSVQAGGANSGSDLATIQNEISQLISGVNENLNNTEFNGIKLLNGSITTSKEMQIGANAGDVTKIPVYDLTSAKIGDPLTGEHLDDINITVPGGLDKALGIIDGALKSVTDVRSQYGALENRFSSTYDNSIQISDSTQSAESTIRDADIAKEMIGFTTANILVETGNALMVQSNKFPQEILKILENIKR